MSCGKPHDTDCATVLDELVHLVMDGEADPTVCAQLREHLEECAPCFEENGLAERVKALVARTCGCESVPDTLRSRVVASLSQVTVESSADGSTTVSSVTVETWTTSSDPASAPGQPE